MAEMTGLRVPGCHWTLELQERGTNAMHGHLGAELDEEGAVGRNVWLINED
jgi:hypothetical protein